MKKFVYCVCLLCAAAFCFSACQKDDLEEKSGHDVQEYAQPYASFTYYLNPSFLVTFQNESRDAASYEWNFGDGVTSSAVNTEHTYVSKGQKTVTLIAYNGKKSDKVSVKLDMTSYITLRNASSYPFFIKIDGVLVDVLSGKTLDTYEVNPGQHSVYVEQQSGYLLWPTTRTYSPACYPGRKNAVVYEFNTVLD